MRHKIETPFQPKHHSGPNGLVREMGEALNGRKIMNLNTYSQEECGSLQAGGGGFYESDLGHFSVLFGLFFQK